MPSISTKRLFTAGTILLNKTIHFENGKITGIENALGTPTFENISAAFFDTHINGGEKLYLTEEVSLEAIDDIFTASLKTGTFYVLPCVITSSPENILKGLAAIKEYISLNPKSGVVGLHLEGPFLNPVKRGAHLAKYVRKPSNEELAGILEAGKGIIKLITIAPEQFTDEQIKMIQATGICISAGHSDATNVEANHAFDLGINLVTHLFNAMSGLHHRKPGLVGATLARKEVWAPIILDGKHCDFDAAKVAFNAKPDKLFIISDALFLGQKKMKFKWEEFDATLINGEYINSDGNLAGSAVSMGECIKNAVEQVEIPLETAIDMATERPAKAIGLAENICKIDVGYPSIFTSFNDDLNTFEVLNMV
ncbi:N-acetylglucosamine-6-phosphate deacetylase [Arcticibacterium luteifluviistationis]|uniref:N-acetylglucosamine-6-phosphate deacetylase n=2 Tax=Arcticibacterium luteifluviistationis TaxID=1784714 RepID=A0A2Z4GHI9_9BACT|nr:N-acetylglucosamine-6-phosphate deacetylase [Arcticibacterium luteifluviistationis]